MISWYNLPMDDRIILHCDCNSFFASVETALNPDLDKVPMAVVGDPERRHGIILAKNELAKKYNVRTAETIWNAKQKCPALICVRPNMEKYYEYSEKCNEIYNRFTDLVEPFGIDESWLDVTASKKLFGDGETIANNLRKIVRDELGITISVGVSFNKIFAKLGSDYKKPNATTVITRETGKKIVFPLPVSDLLFVGDKAKKVLEKLGIYTIGELARYDKDILIGKLGQLGHTIYEYANGRDESPVMPFGYKREEKTVGNGETFEVDVMTFEDLYPRILKIAESVGWRMRHKGVKASTLQISIKDASFKVIQRQKKLAHASNITLDIAKASMEIIKNTWTEGKPIRSITITASNLVSSEFVGEQLSFFGDNVARQKAEKLQQTVDSINEKLGKHSIRFGSYFIKD